MQKIILYEFEQKLYCLVYDQTGKLEYFLEDDFSSDVEAIYITKINSVNQHTKLSFIEYETDKFGIVNLGDNSRFQAGSKILLQMTWLGDKEKNPKFTTDIKLVGRYVILVKNSKLHIFAKTLTNLDRIKEISAKYSNYGLIFRTALFRLDNLEYLEQEINQLINKLKQIQDLDVKNSLPTKLSNGVPKYIQLLRNIAYSNNYKIITNSRSVYNTLNQYTELWQLLPIEFNLEQVLDICYIQDQILQTHVEVSGIKLEIHKLSGINLIDINGSNQLMDFYTINYLAIDEAVKQIKIRDLTGIILIDFIKNMSAKNKVQLTDKITRMLQDDWRHTKVLGFSNAGICELIRNK